LAWHLARGIVAIPKSCTPARIEENWAAVRLSLTEADVAALSALDAGARFCAPAWMSSWD